MSACIELLDYQVEHLEKLKNTLDINPMAFDMSPMGAGKTYTTMKLFQEGQKEGKWKWMVVICPKNMISKWEDCCEEYDIPLAEIMTYQALTGQKERTLKHNLLSRQDTHEEKRLRDGTVQNHHKISFYPTQDWKNVLRDDGVFVVIDEAHNAKNNSATNQAIRALFRPLINQQNFEPVNNSRIIVISATLFDKEEHSLNFYKIMRVLTEQIRTFDMGNGTFVRLGAEQIERFGRRFDPNILKIIEKTHGVPVSLKDEQSRAFHIFQFVMKNHLASLMDYKAGQCECYTHNAYYTVHPEDLDAVVEAVGDLEQATGYSNGDVNFDGNNQMYTQIGAILSNLEFAKAPLFLRIVREKLEENPSTKIVVGLNFTKTFNYLSEQLSEFNPLTVNGKTKEAARKCALELFQKPSFKHRLLIVNTQTMCCGVDLDDKYGDFPRFCLLSPSFKSIETAQFIGRFSRGSYTKSRPCVHIVYGDIAEKFAFREQKILKALAKKGEVISAVNQNGTPIEFLSFTEKNDTSTQ